MLLGLAVAVTVTLAPSAGARAGSGSFDAGLTAGWQRTEDAWRTHGPLPGITAAVQLSDGSTWKGVSGAARLPPTRIPVTADTPFLIASVTKTFVASTVLELVHDGKLSLRDPLSKWLPNFDRADRITVRMLLAHTSGIADIFDSPDFNRRVLKRPDHVWTFDEILSMVGAPHFAPGAAWDYSNTNYILLGRIIQMVTGNGVAQEIRRRFLDPLGLNDTWFQGEETQGSRTTAAIGYARTWSGWRPWAPHDSLRPSTSEATFVWSAGAMVSTARDLATWARDLYGGHVLAPGSLAQMLRFGSHRYGLGAERRIIGGRRAWGHGGSLEGFETSMWYLPSLDASVVVMWNRWPFESDYMANQLATRLVNTIDRDTVPPVVTAPHLAIDNGATVPLGRVPVIAWWHGHDRKGHIVRYQARLRRGNGAWRTVRLRNRLATSVALKVRPGAPVVFEVRAVDGTGNWSPWQDSPTVQTRIVDSTGPGVELQGTWRTVAARHAMGHSLESSIETGSTASIDLPAISVGVVAMEGRARGTVGIQLDGGAGVTVDLHRGRDRSRQIVYAHSWTAPASHRLVLTVNGTPPHVRVDFDALLVLQLAAAP